MAKSTKHPAKKLVKKAAPAKSAKPAKVLPAKKEPAPTKVAAKPVAAKPAAAKHEPSKSAVPKAKGAMTAADLKRMILERKSAGPAKSISFSLDEVREIAKKNETTVPNAERTAKAGKAANGKAADAHAKLEKPHKPNHVKAASLADILGFAPGKKAHKPVVVHEDDVPEKFRRYYKMLVELRSHVMEKLGEHTEDTLMKSAKDDSGDLSGYGQHMADAGTDTFDRDFALSLVSSEQEALSEIEAAIKRIHDGTYGICEVTQKPIAKERLLAVPFTRYSAEAQKEVERHSHRSQQRGGLFGDTDEEGGGKASDDDSGGDE